MDRDVLPGLDSTGVDAAASGSTADDSADATAGSATTAEATGNVSAATTFSSAIAAQASAKTMSASLIFFFEFKSKRNL